MQENLLGIIVNPMSGRDVRRVVARASTSTHYEKQQQVTRLVLAALEHGVARIFLADEPFRISSRAVEHLPQRSLIEILKYPLTHTARDTETMADLMWAEGCRTFIVLGGDGTNRIVARRYPDATILPLSTGTNNVFPVFVEASIAGAAAGIIASKQLQLEQTCIRCKQIHLLTDQVDSSRADIALIDAVLLKNDELGSLLPFSADHLSTLVLTRAEPASVGLSPVGGYLDACGHHDDFGLVVECAKLGKTKVTVPISPGLWQEVGVKDFKRIQLDTTISVSGAGILAFDGDRSIGLGQSETALLKVCRDGPWIIEPDIIMHTAAAKGLLSRRA
ncbi:MAG: hypothetical protein HOI43_08635 [Gammaproteobacteria bacterium]|nr:hypothetical protein [Gammaproteobacteria bacterium]